MPGTQHGRPGFQELDAPAYHVSPNGDGEGIAQIHLRPRCEEVDDADVPVRGAVVGMGAARLLLKKERGGDLVHSCGIAAAAAAVTKGKRFSLGCSSRAVCMISVGPGGGGQAMPSLTTAKSNSREHTQGGKEDNDDMSTAS